MQDELLMDKTKFKWWSCWRFHLDLGSHHTTMSILLAPILEAQWLGFDKLCFMFIVLRVQKQEGMQSSNLIFFDILRKTLPVQQVSGQFWTGNKTSFWTNQGVKDSWFGQVTQGFNVSWGLRNLLLERQFKLGCLPVNKSFYICVHFLIKFYDVFFADFSLTTGCCDR